MSSRRNIDGMAMVKMNVFHWHLSEDQGFRIESKKFPKLHEKGSGGLYYTQEQVRDVIDVCRRARYSRPARIRHARAHRRMDAGLSRTGQRAGAV